MGFLLFGLLYPLALSLWALVYLPKIVVREWKRGGVSAVRFAIGSFFFPRIALALPENYKVLWVHAVSLGEVKGVIPLIEEIRRHYPKPLYIVLSTATETGYEEASRYMPPYKGGIDRVFRFPVDFRFVMKSLVTHISPDLFIMMEGDLWFQLLDELKKKKVPMALVNGKLSSRSLFFYRLLRLLKKDLFTPIDLFCLQSTLYDERFGQLGIPESKRIVLGNLKYDKKYPEFSEEEKKRALASFGWNTKGDLKKREGGEIAYKHKILTIASTHKGEENLLLKVCKELLKEDLSLHILVAPRHPERFKEIALLLKTLAIPFVRYSTLVNNPLNDDLRGKKHRVVLIDQMGVLPLAYALSSFAIVGGSFVEGIGGHDIIEPLTYGTPVLFGPYMEAQEEMKREVLRAKAGRELSLGEGQNNESSGKGLLLKNVISHLLKEEQGRVAMGERGKQLAASLRGSSRRTWQEINHRLSPFDVL